MSDGSKIGWLAMPGYRPASWNPLRAVAHGGSKRQGVQGWACERISPGCQRCYAEALNQRLGTGEDYVVGAPVDHVFDERVLAKPLSWRAPRCIFPCSMTDMFGRWVTDQQIADILSVAAVTPQHVYVILTKRAERAAALLTDLSRVPWFASRMVATAQRLLGRDPGPSPTWPLPNVFIGPSVEDQQRADERMPHAMKLAECGWRVVISYEPSLGPVDWRPWIPSGPCPGCGHAEQEHSREGRTFGCQHGNGSEASPICGCRKMRGEPEHKMGDPMRHHGLAWILAGAESGRDRRAFDPSWIPADACAAAGVPLFVKQGSALQPGKQGNLPDGLWALKQLPSVG